MKAAVLQDPGRPLPVPAVAGTVARADEVQLRAGGRNVLVPATH